jgi:hypothetical protein
MNNILLSVLVLVGIAGVAVLCSWLLGRKHSTTSGAAPPDSANAHQIGAATGMLGGDIADAAVNQFALQHKQASTGQPSTLEDAAKVAAMQQAMKSPKP